MIRTQTQLNGNENIRNEKIEYADKIE